MKTKRGEKEMNNNVLLVIAGMAAVTYLPRLLPFHLFSKLDLSKRMMLFLKCIPYSALGALLLPDIFTSVGFVSVSAAGALVAVALAYKFENMIVTVAGAIFTVYVWLTFFPA